MPQGMEVVVDTQSGFAGFSVRLLEILRDEMPDVPIMTFGTPSPSSVSGSTPSRVWSIFWISVDMIMRGGVFCVCILKCCARNVFVGDWVCP